MSVKFLIPFLVILSGCEAIKNPELPNLAFTGYEVPEGTPIFQKGYRDGCENGLFSRGNNLYRARYGSGGFRYDGDLIDNPEYRFGVSRGYGYCFTLFTAGGQSTGGWDNYILPKGSQFDMGRKSIDGTVNYEVGHWKNAANVQYGGLDAIFGVASKPKGFSVFGSHPLYGTDSGNQLFGWNSKKDYINWGF